MKSRSTLIAVILLMVVCCIIPVITVGCYAYCKYRNEDEDAQQKQSEIGEGEDATEPNPDKRRTAKAIANIQAQQDANEMIDEVLHTVEEMDGQPENKI